MVIVSNDDGFDCLRFPVNEAIRLPRQTYLKNKRKWRMKFSYSREVISKACSRSFTQVICVSV